MNPIKETFDSRNALPQRMRDTLIPLLNRQLAATLDLYSKVKYAHWNVRGMSFMLLHLLFDDLAQSLNKAADELAERVAALGGMALGTVRMIAAHSYLADLPPEIREDRQTIAVLAGRFAQYDAELRAALQAAAEYGDPATTDLLTAILRKVEKQLWFLEAHLQVV